MPTDWCSTCDGAMTSVRHIQLCKKGGEIERLRARVSELEGLLDEAADFIADSPWRRGGKALLLRMGRDSNRGPTASVSTDQTSGNPEPSAGITEHHAPARGPEEAGTITPWGVVRTVTADKLLGEQRPSEAVSVPLGPPLQFSAPPGTFEESEERLCDCAGGEKCVRDLCPKCCYCQRPLRKPRSNEAMCAQCGVTPAPYVENRCMLHYGGQTEIRPETARCAHVVAVDLDAKTATLRYETEDDVRELAKTMLTGGTDR